MKGCDCRFCCSRQETVKPRSYFSSRVACIDFLGLYSSKSSTFSLSNSVSSKVHRSFEIASTVSRASASSAPMQEDLDVLATSLGEEVDLAAVLAHT